MKEVEVKRLIVLVALVLALAAACGETVIITPGGGDVLGSRPGSYPLDFPISLEEIAVEADVVARVNLLGVSTSTDIWQMDYREQFENESEYPGADVTRYVGTLDYRFRAVEYLKGTGDSEIVARVQDNSYFYGHPTREQAQANADDMLADRDDSWDSREAIIFLRAHNGWTSFPLETGEYDFGYTDSESGDDGYTITSPARKKWLPAVVSSSSRGRSASSDTEASYYLDAPGGSSGRTSGKSGSTPVISLTDIKAKVEALEQEVAAGDGSEAYRECVKYKYQSRRNANWRIEKNGGTYPYRTFPIEMNSGLPAGTEAFQQPHEYTARLSARGEQLSGDLQLLGGDANLFTAPLTDGGNVHTTRPLPAGEYHFFYLYRGPHLIPCNGHPVEWERDYEVLLTVSSAEGVVHEAFFDPITDGTVVAADSTIGVLKPTAFTDANDTSATIERISWDPGTGDSGTLKIKVKPHTGLADHMVDLIGLDGLVSLSLDVDNAAMDAANQTLSWTVASQPWQSGDQLMLRIHKWCSIGAAVTNPGANAGLVSDCETLLGLKSALAGTGTLNWSADLAMSEWRGISISDAPRRVIGVKLQNSGLGGIIPVALGELTGLEDLWLDRNQLTGEIPAELGNLTSLYSLYLDQNQLTGEIPAELGNLSVLEDLFLYNNQLTGSIPPEVASLEDLRQLWITNNQLSGVLPGELAGLDELYTLRLSGNSFEGCVPAGLRDVATNDIASLGLEDCPAGAVSAPTGLSASLSEGTFSLMWDVVTGAGLYEAQYTTDAADAESVAGQRWRR